MNKQEIENRLEIVNLQIIDLELEKTDLELSLVEIEETFSSKFKNWWESDLNLSPEPYIPKESEYPYLRKLLDKMDCDRYKTYDLTDFLCEEMCYVTDPKEIDSYHEDYWASELEMDPTVLYTCIATELLKGRLKSFKYDW